MDTKEFRRLSCSPRHLLLSPPSSSRLSVKSSSIEVPRGAAVDDETYQEILMVKLRERSKSINSNLCTSIDKKYADENLNNHRRHRLQLTGSQLLVWFPNSVDYLQRISGTRRNALTLDNPIPKNHSLQARLMLSKSSLKCFHF